MNYSIVRILTLALICFGISLQLQSCGKTKETVTTAQSSEEYGQQMGDVMASIDEFGTSTGSLALLTGAQRTFARLEQTGATFAPLAAAEWLIPQVQAASCSPLNTFSTCSSNIITRTFGGCTLGSTTFSGTVGLTWSDAAVDSVCQITADGHSITRNPDFTVTGRMGATLTVSRSGSIGQKVTRTSSGVFSFTNDGIRRKFTTPSGSVLLDHTTQTTSAITVTGALRAGRVVSGGTLRVTDHSNSKTCDYSPSGVTWNSSCNCAVSGTWSGNCSDGKTTSLLITGCGTGTLTVDSESQAISFDRCASI